jgi:hypothetical protein
MKGVTRVPILFLILILSIPANSQPGKTLFTQGDELYARRVDPGKAKEAFAKSLSLVKPI